jgi:hypothetical protein
MTPRTSNLASSIPILLLLGACADQQYDPADVCATAANVLEECGETIEQSPFGTCQPEQRALAQRLVDGYAAEGCSWLVNGKADSAACVVLPFLCVKHAVDELAPFVSDGCSMFPDGTLGDPTRWQHCCIVHDFAYYTGGPEEARETADRGLQACIAGETNQGLADLMYYGVRLGGTPALPTPWRWGYGWAYDPVNGYRTLSDDQARAAAANIAAYKADPVAPHAVEQRLRELADSIASVPGLQKSIDLITAVVRSME